MTPSDAGLSLPWIADVSRSSRTISTLSGFRQGPRLLSGTLPGPHITKRAADAALTNILHSPPFVASPSVGDTIARFVHGTPLGGLLDAINAWLNALGSAAMGPARYVFVLVATLIAVAGFIFVAHRLSTSFAPQATADDAGGIAAGLMAVDAATARRQAAALAESGDYRDAAHYLFLATVLALDEAGHVRVDDATGNRDILRQARAVPRLAEALAPVIRLFDEVWFGGLSLTREQYQRYHRLTDHVFEVLR